MTVLNEVKQKRDYAQSRKDAGEQGYDPAIDFYNRIIAEIEMLEMNLQNAVRLYHQEQSVINWLETFHLFSPINEGYGDNGIDLLERCSDGWILDKELLTIKEKEMETYPTFREAVLMGISLTENKKPKESKIGDD